MARMTTLMIVILVGSSLLCDKITHGASLKEGKSNRLGLFRQKRNIAQFKSMIECATSKSAWDYNLYGCYCGFGGEGDPVDETDLCCKAHDQCYQDINDNNVCSYSWDVYLNVYDRKGCTGCADTNDECERAICECDGEAARCFAAAEGTWSDKYDDWPQGNC